MTRMRGRSTQLDDVRLAVLLVDDRGVLPDYLVVKVLEGVSRSASATFTSL